MWATAANQWREKPSVKFKEAKLQQWVTVGKPSQLAGKIDFPRPEQIHFSHVPEAHLRHYVNNFSEDEIMKNT